MQQPRALRNSIDTAEHWIQDLAASLEEDEAHAYHALKAVLHPLRDRLPHEESAHLASQLPVIIRGVYYDGWRPARTPEKYHKAEEFLQRVADEGRYAGLTEAEWVTNRVMKTLRRHVSGGEMKDVMAVLPPALSGLLS